MAGIEVGKRNAVIRRMRRGGRAIARKTNGGCRKHDMQEGDGRK